MGEWLRKHFGPSRSEIWAQLAASIGGAFEPGSFWCGDHVRAHVADWTVLLDVYTEPVGRAAVAYTRLRAPYVNQDGFRFAIHSTDFMHELAKRAGLQDIEIGNPALDREFMIQTNEPEEIRKLLADPHLCGLLLEQRGLHIEVKHDEGLFRPHFPEGVDELCCRILGRVTEPDRLVAFYNLFAAVLNQLCHIGSAYEKPPSIPLSP